MRLPLFVSSRVHPQLAVHNGSPAASAKVLWIRQRIFLLFVLRFVVVFQEDCDVLDLLLARCQNGCGCAVIDQDGVADEQGNFFAL